MFSGELSHKNNTTEYGIFFVACIDLFLLLLLFWLNQISSFFFLLACLNGTQFDLCQNTSAQIAMEEKKKKSTLGDKKLLEISESCWTDLTWCCYLHEYNRADVILGVGGGFIPNLHGDGFSEKPKALRSVRQPPSRQPHVIMSPSSASTSSCSVSPLLYFLSDVCVKVQRLTRHTAWKPETCTTAHTVNKYCKGVKSYISVFCFVFF